MGGLIKFGEYAEKIINIGKGFDLYSGITIGAHLNRLLTAFAISSVVLQLLRIYKLKKSDDEGWKKEVGRLAIMIILYTAMGKLAIDSLNIIGRLAIR